MGASSTGGPVYFNVDLPKQINSDGQRHYEEVCQNNKDLLQTLTDTVHAYCLDGNCQDLGLLLRAVSFLFESGEQVLRDNAVCSRCLDRECSAAGTGEGLTD